MKWSQWMVVAGYALAANLGSGCGACGTPTDIVVEGDPADGVKIDWQEANAMGLYFTDLDAVIPGGPDDHVKGHAYWVVEATDFPDGFGGPVMYGRLPSGGKDATAEHGGVAGGEPLTCGVTYKVSIVALGGSAETTVEWSCPRSAE